MEFHDLHCFQLSTNHTPVNANANITFDSNQLGFWQDEESSRFTIVATDYNTYAVVASCLTKYGSDVLILTRSLKISNETIYLISEVLNSINFDPNYLMQTSFTQATCSIGGYFVHQNFSNLLLYSVVALSTLSGLGIFFE